MSTNEYLQSAIEQFEYYKSLGEKTMAQLTDEQLFWQYNPESNSIAIIVKHLWGNMLSRWTDFLTSDGEKEWRKRDEEFIPDLSSRDEIVAKWDEGWKCLFDAISSLTEEDFEPPVFIRHQKSSVVGAINRQLAHYACHVGQMIYIGKMALDEEWSSLSIPKGYTKP